MNHSGSHGLVGWRSTVAIAAFAVVAMLSHSMSVSSPQEGVGSRPGVERLAATYYDVEQFVGTLLLNNKGPRDLEIEMIFRSLSGAVFRPEPVLARGNKITRLDLKALIREAGIGFRQGRVELAHEGKWLEVGAHLTLVNGSLMFSEQLIDPDRDFASTLLHGLWWTPRSRSKLYLALANRVDQPLKVDVSAEAEGMQFEEQVRLSPYETQLLPLHRRFPPLVGGLPSKGGITVEHDGNAGDLLARTLVMDRPIGFSHQMEFFDAEKAVSNQYHGTGLRVSPFQGQSVAPLILVRNVSQKASQLQVRIPLTDSRGNQHLVELPSVELQPGEVVDLSGVAVDSLRSLASLDERGPNAFSGPEGSAAQREAREGSRDRPEDPSLSFLRDFSAGIEFEYSGSPGDVIVAAASLSEDRDHIFPVTILDVETAPVSAGGIPWTVEGDQTTLLHFKNTSTEQQVLFYQIDFPDGLYVPDFATLAPGESRTIDVRRLQNEQIPDRYGDIIPRDASGGQVLWFLRRTSDQIRSPEFRSSVGIIARGEYVDLVSGVSSTYSCFNCCCNDVSGSLSPGSGSGLVGETTSFSAIETHRNCYGSVLSSFSITPDTWSSSNTQVATVSNGLANCSGPGSSNIEAGWWIEICFDDYYDGCVPSVEFVDPIAPLCVYDVRITGPQPVKVGAFPVAIQTVTSPSGGSLSNWRIISGDSRCAEVTSTGTIEALAPGSVGVRVDYTLNGKTVSSDTFNFNLTAAPQYVRLDYKPDAETILGTHFNSIERQAIKDRIEDNILEFYVQIAGANLVVGNAPSGTDALTVEIKGEGPTAGKCSFDLMNRSRGGTCTVWLGQNSLDFANSADPILGTFVNERLDKDRVADAISLLAIHEIGHALGLVPKSSGLSSSALAAKLAVNNLGLNGTPLYHNTNPDSIMYPVHLPSTASTWYKALFQWENNEKVYLDRILP